MYNKHDISDMFRRISIIIFFFQEFQHINLSDCELCHFTSKPIDDEDTLKSFMALDITPCRPVFRIVVGSQIVVPQQSFPHNDTLMTRTHDLGSDTICRIVSYAIPLQKQLVMKKTHSNLLWPSISHHMGLFL